MTTSDQPLSPADAPLHIQSSHDAERLWRALMGPLGFGGHSLWIQLLDGQHVTKQMVQIEECDDLPDDDPEPLSIVLATLSELVDAPRFAFLRSRPGSGAPDELDRRWISMMYAACRLAGVSCEIVHLAHDRDIVPVPMDALAA
ncbi:hypothetical protein KLP28_11300 [Nocardioidaceae bacterium]|nr:hypothetical protein KLP28_11300 [Nocardioidaceae bacterium]